MWRSLLDYDSEDGLLHDTRKREVDLNDLLDSVMYGSSMAVMRKPTTTNISKTTLSHSTHIHSSQKKSYSPSKKDTGNNSTQERNIRIPAECMDYSLLRVSEIDTAIYLQTGLVRPQASLCGENAQNIPPKQLPPRNIHVPAQFAYKKVETLPGCTKDSVVCKTDAPTPWTHQHPIEQGRSDARIVPSWERKRTKGFTPPE